MPLYEVQTPEGLLDDQKRSNIARGIKAAHIEETGAPGELVHVSFTESPAGRFYTNGSPSTTGGIRGSIRAGRSIEVKHRLMERLNRLYTDETGVSALKVLVGVVEIPSQWIMEGGYVLPEPNAADEADWLAKIQDAFGETAI